MPAADGGEEGKRGEGVDLHGFVGEAGCDDWQARMCRGVPCSRRRRRFESGKKRHEIMGCKRPVVCDWFVFTFS